MFSEPGPAALLVQADDQGQGRRGPVHQGRGGRGYRVQAQGPLCHRAVHLRLPPGAQHQVSIIMFPDPVGRLTLIMFLIATSLQYHAMEDVGSVPLYLAPAVS